MDVAVLLLIAAGPALGAVVGWRLLGKRQARLLGSWPWGAALSALAPVCVMAALGLGLNDLSVGQAAVIGAVAVLYGLGEEIGWRGFLNDALRPYRVAVRVVVTAGLWWLWHLWFIEQGADGGLTVAYSMQRAVVDFAVLLGASAMFLAILNESGSLLEVGAFHAAASIALTMPAIDLPQPVRLTAGAVLFGVLVLLHLRWKARG